MDTLKKLLSFFIGLALMLMIGLLTTSILVKDVFQNQVIGSIVRTEMVSEAVNNSDFEGKNEINELLDDKELYNIIDDVVTDYVNSIGDEDYKVNEKTIDGIIDYVVDHQDELEKITGEKIDISEIKSEKSKQELTDAMNKSFADINNADSSVKKVIKGYGFITSNKFRALLIVGIIVSLLLLILLQGSVYDWLTTAGVSLITCGVFVSALYAVVSALAKAIAKNSDVPISINPTSIIIIGIIELGVGILLIIIKSIVKKGLAKKSENEKEIIIEDAETGEKTEAVVSIEKEDK